MPPNHPILCQPLLLLSSVLPRIRSSLMSCLFASGGQSIDASASASVLLLNIQGWFPLGLTGLISLIIIIRNTCKVCTIFLTFNLTHLILITTLRGGCYCYPHFTDKGTETPYGQVTCPRSQNQHQKQCLAWASVFLTWFSPFMLKKCITIHICKYMCIHVNVYVCVHVCM